MVQNKAYKNCLSKPTKTKEKLKTFIINSTVKYIIKIRNEVKYDIKRKNKTIVRIPNSTFKENQYL